MAWHRSILVRSGSAYLVKLAVKITTSNLFATSSRKWSTQGLLRTYTSTTLASISTGMM